MTVRRKLPEEMTRDARRLSRAIAAMDAQASLRGFALAAANDIPSRFARVRCAWRSGDTWLILHLDGSITLTRRD